MLLHHWSRADVATTSAEAPSEAGTEQGGARVKARAHHDAMDMVIYYAMAPVTKVSTPWRSAASSLASAAVAIELRGILSSRYA